MAAAATATRASAQKWGASPTSSPIASWSPATIPRSESPQQIINQVLLGVTRKVLAVTDRRDAIRAAINAAAADDIVLIAGKGHEAYQIVAANRLPFSDLAEARLALRQKQEA